MMGFRGNFHKNNSLTKNVINTYVRISYVIEETYLPESIKT